MSCARRRAVTSSSNSCRTTYESTVGTKRSLKNWEFNQYRVHSPMAASNELKLRITAISIGGEALNGGLKRRERQRPGMSWGRQCAQSNCGWPTTNVKTMTMYKKNKRKLIITITKATTKRDWTRQDVPGMHCNKRNLEQQTNMRQLWTENNNKLQQLQLNCLLYEYAPKIIEHKGNTCK